VVAIRQAQAVTLQHSAQAFASYDRARVVSRALTQVSLASEHVLGGDPAGVVTAGHEALAAAEAVQSRRLLDRLAELSRTGVAKFLDNGISVMRHASICRKKRAGPSGRLRDPEIMTGAQRICSLRC
jgi:hypothetical protein